VSDPEPSPPEASGPKAADLDVGAFSDHGPWLVESAALTWRRGLDGLRVRTHATVPVLLRRRRVPPGGRTLRVAALIGWAVARWYLRDRGHGADRSRAGLSRRLRRAFERLGPTYIKLGQILSSGEGIFPEQLVREFRLLRDRVPGEAFDVVRATVEQDLGRPLQEVFAHFETTPLAAASIAQVHAARLVTGESVVVKVQRSAVAALVRQDLAIMSWLAPALVGRIPVAALANPPALVELFADTIVEELDFRLEADNMLDVARVLVATDQRTIVVPRPHPSLVTRRVLVMERLDGFPWDDVAGMQSVGIDTTAVVRASMVAFLEGALFHGVFHGDLHGGNLLVQPDGRVALLDFGITGRLDESRRLAFLRLLLGGTFNDLTMQVESLRDLGAFPPDTDVAEVIAELGLDLPAQDPTTMTADELMQQLRDITKALLGFGATMPKELMLFVKDLLFCSSAIATHAPDIDLFAEITHIATYFATNHGERIAGEVGVDPRQRALDLTGIKASIGLTPDVDAVTYRDLQARRELIRERMQKRHRRPGRR